MAILVDSPQRVRVEQVIRRVTRSFVRVYATLDAAAPSARQYADSDTNDGGNSRTSAYTSGVTPRLLRRIGLQASTARTSDVQSVARALSCITTALLSLSHYAIVEVAAAADACIAPVRSYDFFIATYPLFYRYASALFIQRAPYRRRMTKRPGS